MLGAHQDFARAQRFERAGEVGGVDFGGAKFAGRNVDMREAGARRPVAERCQVVVLVRAQQMRVGSGAGGDNAGDLAAHQFFTWAGVLHLIADGHAVAFVDEPRDIAFGRVVGNAAHRDGRRLFPYCATSA